MPGSEQTDSTKPESCLGPGGAPFGPEKEEGLKEPLEEAKSVVEEKSAFFVSLRYSRIKLRGSFSVESPAYFPRDWVLAKTSRGIEQAQVLGKVRTVIQANGVGSDAESELAGQVIRKLSPAEVDPPWLKNERFTAGFDTAQRMIWDLSLPMKLTDVETLPKGDKAIFYFLADGRVDFRQLVRNLARALKLRVEMKQIGVRDEARLKGTCGHCGLDLCCCAWIRKMAPVNMKMAKAQKTTLDPDKISGRCGRLLCCLRYEEEVYIKNRKLLPQRNSAVETPDGHGRVMGLEVLKMEVRVALDSGEKRVFPAADLKFLGYKRYPEDEQNPMPSNGREGDDSGGAAETGKRRRKKGR